MREAHRSYEANMRVLWASRRMLERTIDLLCLCCNGFGRQEEGQAGAKNARDFSALGSP